jgi:hypothetical protein
LTANVSTLEGCKMVAGGRNASEDLRKKANALRTPEGCQLRKLCSLQALWHPFGMQFLPRVSGGLRVASTSGYRLPTLQVVENSF